jgi:SAM-dependent methyltransferase
MTDAWYADRLACPDCGSDLAWSAAEFVCPSCGYQSDRGPRLDLRPANPPPIRVEFFRGSTVGRETEAALLNKIALDRPPLTYDGPLPGRRGRDLLSALGPYLSRDSRVLEVGCGARNLAAAFGHLGCFYVGIDCAPASAADLLADAHSLPFRAETFDAVLAAAVPEHLYNPFLAFQEIGRVLRPGGVCCGTASQGDPVALSYFNFSAWALFHLAETSGLRVRRLWPEQDTLRALARRGRYPRLIRLGLGVLDFLNRRLPLMAPRKAFGWSKRERQIDALYRAASICFVLQKP